MCESISLLELLRRSLENATLKFHYNHQQLVEVSLILKDYKSKAQNKNYQQAFIPLSKIDELLSMLEQHVMEQQTVIQQVNTSHAVGSGFCDVLLKREKQLIEIIKKRSCTKPSN